MREYNLRNKEKVAAKNLRYYSDNRDVCIAKQAARVEALTVEQRIARLDYFKKYNSEHFDQRVAQRRKARAERGDAIRLAEKQSKARCAERVKKNLHDWRKRNKAKVDAGIAAWVAKNPERVKTAKRRYLQSALGRAMSAMATSEKRALTRQATPNWFDKEQVRAVYNFAVEFREAGMAVDVDHIVPLKGKNVCGLHVQGNLRVCLQSYNRKKSNTLVDWMLT